MAFKAYTEEIPDFSLLEVGPCPDIGNGGDYGIFTVMESGLQYETVIVLQRDQMIDYFEVVKIVDRGEVVYIVEFQTGGLVKETARL